MNINKAFGIVLKKEFEERNIDIKHFAIKSNVSRGTFYLIFDGEVSPSLETIHLIAKELGMSTGRLVSKAYKITIQ